MPQDEAMMLRAFAEMERDELRRMECASDDVGQMIESLFGLEFADAEDSEDDLY